MPVCSIFLLSLSRPISQFLNILRSSSLTPLTVARVVRWIVRPTTISKDSLYQSKNWDVLLILPTADTSLPQEISHLVRDSWTIQTGVPSKLLASYPKTNSKLLHPSLSPLNNEQLPDSSFELKLANSTQNLELTRELNDWIRTDQGPQGAISMLNLLAFLPGQKEQYMKYGKAFADSVGSSRGGTAKLVGKTVPGTCSDGSDEWEEMALAHYPSLRHFASMIGSEDYQQANHKWRVPNLKDTCILCTTELDLDRRETKANL